MSGVDNRVVHMTFDNAKFERDIAKTLESLAKLKAAMDFSAYKKGLDGLSDNLRLKMTMDSSQVTNGLADVRQQLEKIQNNASFAPAQKGLNDLAEAGKKFHLNGMIGAVSGVSKSFIAMSTIAITALATIVSHAVTSALHLGNVFTFAPIISGFQEMETNMNSIQTILANTKSKGTTLDQVNAALQKLNEYSDKTIYNFGQMADSIGKFTAAGIDLDTSVKSIKGIANLAAISGSNAQQASSAMYQLSQALGTGTLRAIDWVSVINAGMGGEVFQKALFDTGKALGTLKDVDMSTTFEEWKDAGNNFKDSLEKDWVTADVLTTALQAFTGELDQQALVALGYTEEQAREMEELGKLGVAAATEVKTLTQLLGTVKEAIGTGWSDSFRIIFGDFEEAKAMFTDFNNIIGAWVSKNADARNKVLGDWKALGGRTLLIQNIKDLFSNLGEILGQVKFAFHDVFPRITGERLFELTEKMGELIAKLDLGKDGLNRVARYASAFFTAIDIGVAIIRRFGEMVGDLFDHFIGDKGVGIALGFFDDLARAVQGLYNTLIAGGGIDKFFDNITEKLINFGDALKDDPTQLFKDIASNVGSALGQLFDSLVFGDFHGGFLAEDSPIVDFVFDIRDLIKEGIDQIGEILLGVQDYVNELLDINLDIHIPQALKDFFTGIDEAVDDNTTNSLAGGFDVVTDALKRFFDIAEKVWDVMTDIGNALDWVWDKMQTFSDGTRDALDKVWDFIKEIGPNLQTFFESDAFDQIISLVDSLALLMGGRGLQQLGSKGLAIDLGGDLGKAGGVFQNLAGTFGAVKTNLDQLTGTLKTMQTQIRASALLKIAEAMAILTASVLVLSLINPESLAKALTALAVGMGQLLGAVALLNFSKNWGVAGSIQLGTLTGALIGIATAMVILSGALAVLAAIDSDKLAAGLIALETLIIEMATAAALFSGNSAGMFVGGTAMIAIATSLVILGGALKIFATLTWEEIAKGMVVITGSLLVLSAAMSAMSLKAPITAPAMIAVATSLVILGAALKIFATMSWQEIGKAGTVLAGALLILSAAMSEMSLKAPITGPALISVALALVTLGAALKIFATMSWEEIGKAMVVLTGSLLILSAAMQSMQGTLAGSFAIGIAAISLKLLGMTLVGLSKIGWKELGKGLAIMAISLAALGVAALILQPAVPAMLALSLALLALGAGFALVGVGAALLAEAFQIIAAAGTAGIDVFMYAVRSLAEELPELLSVLLDSILVMIQQMIDALPALIEGTGKVIEALLRVIIDAIPDITVAAIKIVEAILKVIRESSDDFVKTGFKIMLDLLKGLEDNITQITDIAATIITRFIKELTAHIPDLVDAAVGMITKFLDELGNHADDILGAAADFIIDLAGALLSNVSKLTDAAFEMLTDFLEEIADHADDIVATAATLIIQFIGGITKNAILITTAATLMIITFIGALAKSALLLVNAGAEIVIDFLHGLAKAIRDHDDELSDAFADLGAAIIEGIIVGLVASAPKLMAKVAKLMSDAVKAAGKPWEWFSPSHVMMRMGNDIIEGLIIGLDDQSDKLNRTVTGVGNSAVKTFQSALTAASLEMERMGEFAPVITPVLDLTSVRATAGQISGILPNTTLNTGVSLQAAQTLASETREREIADSEESADNQTPRELNFTQNNYSPEVLNTAKIHKQTRNLIVLTKEELEIP